MQFQFHYNLQVPIPSILFLVLMNTRRFLRLFRCDFVKFDTHPLQLITVTLSERLRPGCGPMTLKYRFTYTQQSNNKGHQGKMLLEITMFFFLVFISAVRCWNGKIIFIAMQTEMSRKLSMHCFIQLKFQRLLFMIISTDHIQHSTTI